VIDIHSHILPEVDDGPKSWEVAEAMCRMAAEDGIEHMVASPHANDRFYYERTYLEQLLANLRQRIGPRPQLSLGCDFHLSYENMQNALQTPAKYCIGSSRYLLVEFSNFSIPQEIDQWFSQMIARGNVPIITHPERNPLLQKDTNRVLQWIELGCTVQVTASAFTDGWGSRAAEIAHLLMRQKAVHFLASDAHNTQRRPPVLSGARQVITKEFGEDLAIRLLETNPRAVVNNLEITS